MFHKQQLRSDAKWRLIASLEKSGLPIRKGVTFFHRIEP